VEIKFRIKEYSQVFIKVSVGYRGLTKFILIDQYVSTEFHIVTHFFTYIFNVT
jgi:hypothetical protein